MAIGRLSYLDVSPEQRREAAANARQRLQSMLGNPFANPEQARLVAEQIERIGQWEAGAIISPVGSDPSDA